MERCGRVGRASWAVLGRQGLFRVIWEPPPPDGHPTWAKFGGPKGGQDGAKMKPKWSPRGTKIEDKNEDEKTALEDRLGAVLGRSLVVLGAVLGSFF